MLSIKIRDSANNMQRTSPAQFEIMVDFMERHGDINKPGSGYIYSRHEKWLELTEKLNLETSGKPKPIQKWRKVWSDLKNNLKKKVAKMQPDSRNGLALTELEMRVISVINRTEDKNEESSQPSPSTQDQPTPVYFIKVRKSTMRVGLPDAINDEGKFVSCDLSEIKTSDKEDCNIESIVQEKIEQEETMSLGSSPLPEDINLGPTEELESSNHSIPLSVEMCDVLACSPTPHSASTPVPSMRRRTRRKRPQLEKNDAHWRKFVSLFATEHLRLRKMELRQQAKWQNLFSRFLTIWKKKI